nr:transposon Pol polyprotein [Lupinus angustifolius]
MFVLNNGNDNLGKFDAKADEGIFLGYSLTSKAYRVFNKRALAMEESVHVSFDETNPVLKDVISCDEDDLPSSHAKENSIVDITNDPKELRMDDNLSSQEEHIHSDLPKEWRTHRNHHIDNIISDISKGITTCRMLDACLNMAFVSQIEPSKIDDAIEDEHWILAMQEELNQFEMNEVLELVPRPKNRHVIGTHWFFRNKYDENGVIIRNKARLVAQGYNQEKDDIIFGSTNESLCSDFGKMMQGEFEMSMMGKLNYFLELQIKQLDNDIFLSQSKYYRDLLKRFDMDDCKPIATPIGSSTYIDTDESGKCIEISKYRGTTEVGLWYPKGSLVNWLVIRI